MVPAAGPETASATVASTVPPQVRKSLAPVVAAGGLLDICVDVRRLDVHPAAALLVREQLVLAAAPALQDRDDRGDVRVHDGLHAPLPALGLVVEAHLVVRDGHVTLLHRGETVVSFSSA